MTPAEEMFDANIKLLQSIHFEGMDQYLFKDGNAFEGSSWETARDQQRQHEGDFGPLQGLVSLSPCEDGTLAAVMYKRLVVRRQYISSHTSWQAYDSLAPIYKMDYNIDLQAGTLNVGTFEQSEDAVGVQVQKMAIPCWGLFESLEANLQTKKTP